MVKHAAAKTEAHIKKVSLRRPNASGFFYLPAFRVMPKFIRQQIPALLAVAMVSFISTQGYVSSVFSVVAVLFLTAVIYTALHHGVRAALTSAAIVVTFNAFILLPSVEVPALSDRNIRRIVLLAVVLPSLAFIVGRLHDRNEYLLQHEKDARKKAEASEEQLRFMAESMPQKVFTNKPDGSPLYANPQWTEYTGLSSEEIAKGDWAKLIHPDDIKDNITRWKHSQETGEPFTYEHRLKRHDGEYHWHITRSQAMRDERGRILMWVGSSTDIHDIKTALQRERKLEKTTARLTEQREELIALNKAKDEFISLASHQLRTPATGAKQYLGMMLEGYTGELSGEQKNFLQKAYESNERQITIVNDLLKVASVDAGKVRLKQEKTDLVDLIRNVIDEQKSKFTERSQRVAYRPKQARLAATVDKNHIRMVIENILDNASKYTPEGKSITVGLQKTKNSIVISIKDEGVGIDPKDIDKVFGKFSRIDNPLSVAVGGSGLGLYWAKKIIDLHGGSITIQSKLNKGSTFSITLPDSR